MLKWPSILQETYKCRSQNASLTSTPHQTYPQFSFALPSPSLLLLLLLLRRLLYRAQPSTRRPREHGNRLHIIEPAYRALRPMLPPLPRRLVHKSRLSERVGATGLLSLKCIRRRHGRRGRLLGRVVTSEGVGSRSLSLERCRRLRLLLAKRSRGGCLG